jgi:hypothetical protein
MNTLFSKFFRKLRLLDPQEHGQDLVEYALLCRSACIWSNSGMKA